MLLPTNHKHLEQNRRVVEARRLDLRRLGYCIVALCLSLTLSACGFHLRDDYQVAAEIQQLRVVSDERSDIHRAVTDLFQRRDVTLIDDPSHLPAVVLGEDRLERRILSMLASGQVAEYELIYILPVTILRANGESDEHNIQILRDYQDDPNYALAKTRELELILGEMRREAARRLLLLLNQSARST